MKNCFKWKLASTSALVAGFLLFPISAQARSDAPSAPAAAAPAVPAITDVTTVEVRAADGELIPTVIVEPKGGAKSGAPIALLLHGLTRKKEDWLSDAYPTYGGALAEQLRANGYRVFLMDARRHGARKPATDGPASLTKRAHAGDTAPYMEMIAATASDARTVIAKALEISRKPSQVLIAGYSMGAQVALMVAAKEKRVTHVVSVVPPFVDLSMGDVAPMNIIGGVQQPWLLLSANQDQFATVEQNLALLETSSSKRREHRTYDSGHALPRDWVTDVERWLKSKP